MERSPKFLGQLSFNALYHNVSHKTTRMRRRGGLKAALRCPMLRCVYHTTS